MADSAYVGFTGATGFFQEEQRHPELDVYSTQRADHYADQSASEQFTTFNFGSYLYKVQPGCRHRRRCRSRKCRPIRVRFSGGPNFPGAQCIVYDSTGGKCVEFHAQCTGATCTNVNYDVVTSYDVPSGRRSRIPDS